MRSRSCPPTRCASSHVGKTLDLGERGEQVVRPGLRGLTVICSWSACAQGTLKDILKIIETDFNDELSWKLEGCVSLASPTPYMPAAPARDPSSIYVALTLCLVYVGCACSEGKKTPVWKIQVRKILINPRSGFMFINSGEKALYSAAGGGGGYFEH